MCSEQLPLIPKPVIQASSSAKLLIIGQAPGLKVHQTGTPWNDASGDRLRSWLQVTQEQFYDKKHIAIMPMGFCYPGRGKSGDLPPIPKCAPTWHKKLLQQMPDIQLTLLIGQYAQQYYLQDKYTLTQRVQNWRSYLPQFIALPHPSPRNNIWLKKNPWFEQELLPQMRQQIDKILSND
nr:uracil-DNA glycosylase family protein [Neptunicella marina]